MSCSYLRLRRRRSWPDWQKTLEERSMMLTTFLATSLAAECTICFASVHSIRESSACACSRTTFSWLHMKWDITLDSNMIPLAQNVMVKIILCLKLVDKQFRTNGQNVICSKWKFIKKILINFMQVQTHFIFHWNVDAVNALAKYVLCEILLYSW